MFSNYRFLLNEVDPSAGSAPGGGAGDTTSPAVPANPSSDFLSMVPDTYKAKPYMKAVDSMDSLLSQFDNLQSMVGRKLGVPAADAPDEEWGKYFDSVGRPKDPTGYQFEEVQYPEGMARSEEQNLALRQLLHASGITDRQAKRFIKGYDEMIVGEIGKLTEAEKAFKENQDKEFNDLQKKFFGERKDEVIEQSKKFLLEHLPQELRDHMGNLDNKSLVMIGAFVDSMTKKYVNQDQIPNADRVTSGAKTVKELEAESRTLMMDPSFSDILHPKHRDTKEKFQGIWDQIGKLSK